MLIAEQVGSAMQVILDTLAPAERAAFVLHDVFGYPFEEISAVLGRSGTAVRQLASRARRKVQGAPEPAIDAEGRARNRAVVEAFLDAAHHGQLAKLLSALAPDAVMHVDPVARRMGALAVYDGANAVAARFDGAESPPRRQSTATRVARGWSAGESGPPSRSTSRIGSSRRSN